MRVFDIFTTLAIFGCLCFTVLQGFVSQSVDQILLEKCESNAGPPARELYQGLAMYFGMYCLYSSEGSTNISLPDRTNTMTHIFCDNHLTVKKCTKYVTNLFRPCLKLEEQASMDIINNLTRSYLDFTCQHEEYFNAFYNATEECVFSNAEALGNCANESLSSYLPDDSPVRDLSTAMSTRLRKPFIIDVEDCLIVKKFQTCSVQVLRGCQNQTSATMADSMMNTIINTTPCAKLLEAQTSPTTELGSGPVEQLEGLLRKKCEKNGDSTSSETAINGLRSFSNCFTSLVNATQFKSEVISAAASPGELETLFVNYTHKVPIFAECVKHVVISIQPCLIPEEQETVNIIHKITRSWLQDIVSDRSDRNTA